MPPETGAAAPGDSGASESSEVAAAEAIIPATEAGAQEPERPGVGERANAILQELGVSDEVQAMVAKPETKKPESKVERPEPGKEEDGEDEPLTEQQKSAAPEWVMPRIHKLTKQKNEHLAARETAERSAAELDQLARQLHAQLQDVSRVRPAPTQSDPLADVLTKADLRTAVQLNEEILEWAEMNPDGLTDVVIGKDADGNEVKRDYSAQEMAAIRSKAGRILRQAAPAKAAWLAEAALHEAVAQEKMPALFDPKTEEYEARQQLARNVPELFARLPGAIRWVGWAMRGRAAEIAEDAAAKAAAKPNGQKPIASGAVDSKVAPFLQKHPPMAPGVPSTRGSPAITGGDRGSKDSEQKETVKQFTEEGGGDEALERLVERTRNAQAPPRRDAALV